MTPDEIIDEMKKRLKECSDEKAPNEVRYIPLAVKRTIWEAGILLGQLLIALDKDKKDKK